MTVIGFEKKRDGTVNLLVFDPMFRESCDVIKLIGQSFEHENPSTLLRAYQRTVKHLHKHNEFEVLRYGALYKVTLD
jgi:zinc finger-containing ubiquitin peptidase 1